MKKILSSIVLLTAILIHSVSAFEVEEKQIFSKAMNKEIPAIFIIPDAYADSTKSFPALYLLHGFDGDCRNWADLTSVENLSDLYNIIIVCPDGDKDSWYFDSPEDPNSQYETHVAVEVGSMSGGLDIRGSTKKWNISQKIGAYEEHPERWDSLTVINQISKIQNAKLMIIVDCGIDDIFIDVNRAFHAKLLETEIPHDYIERPGAHNWAYWNNAVKYQLLFFRGFFNQIINRNQN